MKKTVIALSLLAAIGVTGCSSTAKVGAGFGASEDRVAVKDQRLSTEFVDEGIKIYYTVFGNVDKIEVLGSAPVWKGNHDLLAEADAKVKLRKFLHGENVSSDRRIKVIGRAIERAQDRGITESTSRELETGDNKANHTAQRQASRVDETLVTALTTITSAGKLRGMRKARDYTVDGGRTYVDVYEWSEKQQGAADQIRGMMLRSR
jgi:hypothetical protein